MGPFHVDGAFGWSLCCHRLQSVTGGGQQPWAACYLQTAEQWAGCSFASICCWDAHTSSSCILHISSTSCNRFKYSHALIKCDSTNHTACTFCFFSTTLGGKLTFQLGWDIQESLDPRNSGLFPPTCVWDQAGTCFVFFLAVFLPRRQPYWGPANYSKHSPSPGGGNEPAPSCTQWQAAHCRSWFLKEKDWEVGTVPKRSVDVEKSL